MKHLRQWISKVRSRWALSSLVGAIALILLCVAMVFHGQGYGQAYGTVAPSRLVLAITAEPKTFNVALNEESPNIFDSLTYVGLLRQNGLTGDIEPSLAEDWQVSEDGLRIVMTLREGLRWSDGQPLTVEDVLFTFNQVCFNPGIPTLLRDTLRIGEAGVLPTVRAVGDRQIEIISPEPFAPLLRSMGGVPIMPKHAMESFLDAPPDQPLPFLSAWGTNTSPADIVTNGPYRIGSYSPGERIIFQRNPYYWGWSDRQNPQPIEEMIWQIVESSDVSLMQFRSGGLDSVGVAAANFSLLKHEEERGDFTIHNGGPQLSTSYLMFNLNRGKRQDGTPLVDPVKSAWFNTLEFRQAIAYSLDRDALINNLLQGLGTVQHSSIALQSKFYLSPEEGLPTYTYDVDQAKRLLQSVGFTYSPEGALFDREGNRVRFTLLFASGSNTAEAIATQVQRDLSRVGIQADLQALTFNALVDRITLSLDWEVQILGTTNSLEPHSGISTWLPDGRLHDFNLRPEADDIVGRTVEDWEAKIGQLYVQAAQATDDESRARLYGEAQILAQQYVPIIYLMNPLALVAVRDQVQGVQYSSIGQLLWNIDALRVQKRSPSP